MTVLTANQLRVAKELYSLGRQAGMTPQHASEFVAAAYSESGLDPRARNAKSGAAGEFQLLSPGYVQKANAMGGVYNPAANARAIAPDYAAFWRSHPDAAPGQAGAAVERSGEGAGFYAKGLPLLKGLGAGAGSPGVLPAAPEAPGGATAPSTAGAFALQMLKQEQQLEQGQPFDLSGPVHTAMGVGVAPPLQQAAMPSPGPFTRGQGTVIVAPHANRPDMPIKPIVLDFLRSVSHVAGEPLTLGTGTNHNQFVVNTTRESEHWTGNAGDVPATGAHLTRLGQDALIAAGMPEQQARQERGGVYNLQMGNHRVQIIFNSNVGGNHYNHLHVGIA